MSWSGSESMNLASDGSDDDHMEMEKVVISVISRRRTLGGQDFFSN